MNACICACLEARTHAVTHLRTYRLFKCVRLDTRRQIGNARTGPRTHVGHVCEPQSGRPICRTDTKPVRVGLECCPRRNQMHHKTVTTWRPIYQPWPEVGILLKRMSAPARSSPFSWRALFLFLPMLVTPLMLFLAQSILTPVSTAFADPNAHEHTNHTGLCVNQTNEREVFPCIGEKALDSFFVYGC